MNIPKKCKVTIYQTILLPILQYGSEVWALTTTTESRLQAAEMRVLRTIRRVTRRDKVRSTTVREDLHVAQLLEMIERNRLRWYGQLMRMEEMKEPKQYLKLKQEGKKEARKFAFRKEFGY